MEKFLKIHESQFRVILKLLENWFIALFGPDVIGRSNYFGICFATLSWKPLYKCS